MKNHIRLFNDEIAFAIITTIIALILGIIGYQFSFSAEHIPFFISAPIATFPLSYFSWKWTFKNKDEYNLRALLGMTFVLTLTIHYLNFVLLGLGRLLCNYLTGDCTDYSGNVESVIETLTWISFLRCSITLYYFGFITWFLLMITGWYIQSTRKKNTKHNKI